MFLHITAYRSFEHIRDYVSSTTRGSSVQLQASVRNLDPYIF